MFSLLIRFWSPLKHIIDCSDSYCYVPDIVNNGVRGDGVRQNIKNEPIMF